jgi:hypothetical protein
MCKTEIGRIGLRGKIAEPGKDGEVGGTPPGNADGCESKGVAGKAIRKVVKTKGE